MTAKMVGLQVSETSGVDHPAHLTEGWVVIKAAGPDALLTDTEEQPVPNTVIKAKPEMDGIAEPDADDAKVCEACGAKPMAKSAEQSLEVLKAAMPAPLRAYMEQVEKAATESAAREVEALAKAAKVAEDSADAEAITKAAAFTDLGLDPAVFGPILRKFAGVSAEGAEAIEKALSAALERGAADTLFTEVGKAAKPDAAATASGALDALAKSAVDAGHAPNLAKALALVAEANPDLYNRYLAEQKG